MTTLIAVTHISIASLLHARDHMRSIETQKADLLSLQLSEL